MSRIKVLIVEDEPLLRQTLAQLLKREADMEVVGAVGDGRQAVTEALIQRQEVILMDLELPTLSGIEATRRIKERCHDVAVLALTMHEDDQYFFEMLAAGASGYVPKRAAPNDLLSAIHAVQRGGVFLFPSVARLLVKDYLQRTEQTGSAGRSFEPLTDREREVLALIAQGRTNQEIADRLVISIKTVNRHRENIMAKLNLHSRVELVRYAIEKGLIELA